MLIKECIYLIEIFLCYFSVAVLIYSIKNKNKYICKNIILISAIYIIYMFESYFVIYFCKISVGLEVVILYFFEFIAGVIYFISIIINIIKAKKSQLYERKNIVTILAILLIILPVMFISIKILQYSKLINNSNLVLVYSSEGNGGFGDYQTFAYAIGDDYCKEFDLGIEIEGYYLKEFLPKKSIEITDINDNTDYEVSFNDNSIVVYKNNKLVCNQKNSSYYSNINFEKGFYIKR